MQKEFPKRPLTKSYEPAQFEDQIYSFWDSNGYFGAKDHNGPNQKAFSIVIPPPNVTGVLHIGHALTNTIQDILVRWRRMHGDNTLWLPGTDHAGIATQAQVEKAIAKEGKGPSGRPQTRHDLGRDAFVARTWKWKEEHGTKITKQLKRMGSSLDWKRERFTMDEGLSAAVREVFVRLYSEKLIYRGERIINWCTRCQTALSDLEVIPTERKGNFWHLAYRLVDESGAQILNKDGSLAQLVIATTRPETLLGDTAVAVHPEDERYREFVEGEQTVRVVLPLVGKLLPIIADSYVDKEFGSGALKITPAHDFNDYDLGKKHGLPIVSVMGKDGKITAEGGAYAGLKFSEAREKILADLAAAGLLVKTEDHHHKVGLCQRCDSVAEPIISKQWFVKIKPLADPAIKAVETGKITFSPKNWEKTYFEWMYNIRDWCISRQLWWGHQIPAWYCEQCPEITVSRTTPKECEHCHATSSSLKQDEDVLDTWFSSALWPFSTLGWPAQTDALKTFYPTSILETGFDIIFFWVARMIMMGIHFMGDVPFHKVYLHAMVRDEKGEKMSKSKGNVIDPLELIDKHGADPLRFALAVMAGQGRDIKLSVDRVAGYQAFCNKIWNATKFFLMQFDEAQGGALPAPPAGWLESNRASLSAPNQWILSRLQRVIEDVDSGLAQFELNRSSQAVYEFTWHELCDWYVELSKLSLKEGGAARQQTLYVLGHVLDQLFALIHPFMPFVTEELWQSLPWTKPGQSLCVQKFPSVEAAFKNTDSELTVKWIQTCVEAIRNFRGENSISPKTEFVVKAVARVSEAKDFLTSFRAELTTLGRLVDLVVVDRADANAAGEAVIPLHEPNAEFRIELKGLVDVEGESRRIQKEIEKVADELAYVSNKLTSESFLAKAPPQLVEKEKVRQVELTKKIEDFQVALRKIQKLA